MVLHMQTLGVWIMEVEFGGADVEKKKEEIVCVAERKQITKDATEST